MVINIDIQYKFWNFYRHENRFLWRNLKNNYDSNNNNALDFKEQAKDRLTKLGRE